MKPLVKTLFVPLFLLVLSWQLLESIELVTGSYQSLFLQLPYVVIAMGLILANQFNRSRTFAALLALGGSYWAIQSYMQASLSLALPLFAFSSVSVLLPVTILVLLIAPERGLWNRFGLPLALTAPVCLVSAYWVFNYFPDFHHPLAAYFAVKPLEGYVLSLGGECSICGSLYHRRSAGGQATLRYRDGPGICAAFRFYCPGLAAPAFYIDGDDQRCRHLPGDRCHSQFL